MGFRLLSSLYNSGSRGSLTNSYFQRLSSRATSSSIARLSSSSFTARSASSASLFRPNFADRSYVQSLSREASANRSYSQVATQTSTVLRGLDTIASQISAEVSNLQSYATALADNFTTEEQRATLKTQVESSLNTIKGLTQTSFKGRNLETGLGGFSVRLGENRENFLITVNSLNSGKIGVDSVLDDLSTYTDDVTGGEKLVTLVTSMAEALNASASQINAYRSGLDAAARVTSNLAGVAQEAVDAILKG